MRTRPAVRTAKGKAAPTPKRKPLSAFRPLLSNPNKHTQQGLGQLEAAMDRHGYVAPMTAARNGAILDGNARLEKSATKFPDVDPLVVEHDGRRPVIMVRTDIKDERDPRARDIIVSSNRVAEIDLDYDLDVLKSFAAEGLLLDVYEFPPGFIETPDFAPVGEDEQGRLDQKAPVTCPGCGLEFVPK